MRVVLDSSVIVKWFKEEKDSDKALELRQAYFEEDFDVVVPDLIFYEISNVMNFDDSFETDQVKEAMKALRDMNFEVVTPHSGLLDRAIELADENDITIYDASFLALADVLNAEMVTTDEKLFKKAADTDSIELLDRFVDNFER